MRMALFNFKKLIYKYFKIFTNNIKSIEYRIK